MDRETSLLTIRAWDGNGVEAVGHATDNSPVFQSPSRPCPSCRAPTSTVETIDLSLVPLPARIRVECIDTEGATSEATLEL
ncbi:MAG: hypothetical protein AB8I08_05345 [Sandaracinaceae bacterium]